jgi:hypothetical protein
MAIEQSKHDLAMTVLAERWNVEDLKQQNAELLAALEAMLDAQSRRRHPLGMPDEGIAYDAAQAANMARAAIAKAKGE